MTQLPFGYIIRSIHHWTTRLIGCSAKGNPTIETTIESDSLASLANSDAAPDPQDSPRKLSPQLGGMQY